MFKESKDANPRGPAGNLIRPSTRAFIEEARRTQGYSTIDLLHGYFYSRWPYLYIGVAAGEHWLARLIKPISRLSRRMLSSRSNGKEGKARSADNYHAKVLTPECARQLVTVKENICLENLEQVIPFRKARDIILKNPDHIVVTECPCRSSRAEPCQPLDVCIVVGEPFASFIAEHHPRRARWIDSEEACDILAVEHRRGHVHHAYFNAQMLGRFFNICNCCSCCCVGMQAMRHGSPMLAPSGYVSTVDAHMCNGCGECVERCPFGSIELVEGTAVVDRRGCMGCEVCVSTCTEGAHSLVRDPSKGVPLDIQVLRKQATPGVVSS